MITAMATSMSTGFFNQIFHMIDQPQHGGNSRRIEECYEVLNVISQGSYGIVYRMRDKISGEVVAVKQMFDGLSASTLSEIYVLESLPRHPSVIELKQVITDDRGRVFMAMEYMDCDLNRFLEAQTQPLTDSEIKFIMKQVLEGVLFLHRNGIMHRDLKPSNILINYKAQLKICDFGLSRHVLSQTGRYSPGVVTLWYRAPELLLGQDSYSSAIDMWSVGCIMAELVSKEALFKGNSEIHQLSCIYGIVVGGHINLLQKRFAAILTPSAYDLLERLLELNPHKRITAEDALNHKWFTECLSV